jgi:predicted SnoaL-like aldol condensation-catalyzing enzyme
MQHLSRIKTVCLLILSSAALISSAAHADMLTGKQAKALCAKGDVGPTTPYGEFPEEAAAKKVVFQWNCMTMVERKIKEGFEKYVDKQWCDHGHLVTKGQNRCGTFDEAVQFFSRMGAAPLKDTDMLEFPVQSSVNGDHVTNYGAGVDIFRVVNGKITDHWDASPAQAISFKDKPAGMADWIMGGMKGPMPGIPVPAKK